MHHVNNTGARLDMLLRDYLWVAAPRTGIEEANRARGCVFEEASVVERVIDECGGARPRVEARDDGGARPRAGRVVDDPRDICLLYTSPSPRD